jgi:hypothetical protein
LELIGVLKGVFPEDVVGLGEVEERLGVGGVRRKGKGKGRRNTEERVGMGSVSDGDEDEDQYRDEGMLVSDVRGRDAERERAGGREDPLIHVFVDQLSFFSLLFRSFFLF